MTSILHSENRERPALIVPIAVMAFAYASVVCVCGVLSLLGQMPMRFGVQLIGSGLEVMGPVPYFLIAFLFASVAWGLLRARQWARRLMILACGVGVVLLVIPISSAVMDERWLAMSADGAQILLRVAIASYLLREVEWVR